MRYTAHKKAKKVVNEINNNRNNYYFIHYSSENFMFASDHSVRITSIAVKSLRTGQTTSFSIHLEAEKKRLNLSAIQNYDDLEKSMLTAFYKFVEKHNTNYKWIHWNMRDVNFGFQAIEHRAQYLGVKHVCVISDANKIDMAILLKDYYGINYIQHPRMKNLFELNNLLNDRFLTGEQESAEFLNHNYLKMHMSTLSKVEGFYQIFNLLCDKKLKTEAKIKDIYGGVLQYFIDVAGSKWYCRVFLWLIPIIIGILVAVFMR